LVDKNFVIGFFGISQDPDTKDYIMVMEYLKDGNLRNFLQKNYRKLSLEIKFSKLITLSNGLNYIHKKGLIHKDFHPGNVLVNISQSTKNPSSFLGHLFITDLGLCKPVNERNTDEKIYGVLPYVAPEVLTGQPYTQASDVYSFGMIMYEIMTGLQPYQGILYDKTLASKVCQGLRPDLDKISLPQLLKDLINKC
jgi:serine/threonine protein kinase